MTRASFRGESIVAERTPLAAFVGELAERAASNGTLQLGYQPAAQLGTDVDVVAVASGDRAGLFATIAAAFALHNVPVVGADVWTTPDGLAVDQFQVLDASLVPWPKLEQTLRRAVAGEIDLDDAVHQRLSARSRHRRRPAAAAPPVTEVAIRNDASSTATLVDVRSPDDDAVLYRLAAVLRDRGLDVQAAKVATLGHEVVDVFYVRTASGEQLADDRHGPLRAALIAALGGPQPADECHG